MIRIEITIDQPLGKEWGLTLEMKARHCQATRAEKACAEGIATCLHHIVAEGDRLIEREKNYAH